VEVEVARSFETSVPYLSKARRYNPENLYLDVGNVNVGFQMGRGIDTLRYHKFTEQY
jgi:hypothetical protein